MATLILMNMIPPDTPQYLKSIQIFTTLQTRGFC